MKLTFKIFIYLIFFTILLSCSKKKIKENTIHGQRIISLAPSITETLFLLDVEKNIIGVSEYSNFPEEARLIQIVSSISDLNLEFILKLKPDIAFILPSQTKFQEQLLEMGIKCHVTDQRSVDKIITSIQLIGKELKLDFKAKYISDSLTTILNNVRATEKQNKNILISIGRDFSSEISSIYSTGKETFLDNIITLLGYNNALDSDVPYPKISAETIIRLDPDIIIDLLPLTDPDDINQAENSWKSLSSLSAVRNKKIYLFTSDYTTIPGPRIFKFIQELSDTLKNKNPE
ncbi:MAG: helical backbone metal receptor [Candidatus Delongbacteria bacterium]|jgi:iron complex transport system substrate-binding protein|nr:helical backbone metal receptor [Candidatus Delongbacteria bacterium]